MSENSEVPRQPETRPTNEQLTQRAAEAMQPHLEAIKDHLRETGGDTWGTPGLWALDHYAQVQTVIDTTSNLQDREQQLKALRAADRERRIKMPGYGHEANVLGELVDKAHGARYDSLPHGSIGIGEVRPEKPPLGEPLNEMLREITDRPIPAPQTPSA